MHVLNGLKIVTARANAMGWRPLSLDTADPYVGEVPTSIGEPLINLVHLTDTHICDAQSPARVEFLDRFADPHHPLAPMIGTLIGTYRAHESMTTQVLESMLQRISRIHRSPITKRSIDAVVFTGDLVDNAQLNELDWFSRILNGSLVQPDSGASDTWQGVGGEGFYSTHYWNPHGTPRGEKDDSPRARYGFPIIPELLDAVRGSFYGSGSPVPWFAVHGNHDALLQGTVAPSRTLHDVVTGTRKFSEISDSDAVQILRQINEVGPASYPSQDEASWVSVTADTRRAFLRETDFYQTLLRQGSSHGNLHLAGRERRFWSQTLERVRLISIDTVNPHGGWQGSVDVEQLEWLEGELRSDRIVPTVILSHHPVQDLINLYHPPQSSPRVGREALVEKLTDFNNVFLWLAGHSHRNRITHHGGSRRGFWQIETASLIDWPQQGRIVEIFQSSPGEISIATTMVDHCGTVAPDVAHLRLDDVHELAGLSRLLSINDWQRRFGPFDVTQNEGTVMDRNRLITVELSI